MHGKKEDVLPFVAPYLINEPSLLPPLPPDEQDEQGEEEQTPGESFSEVVEVDVLSQHEQDSWIDQEDPFEQRHLPTSIEAAPIEEEDIKQAFAQRVTHIISNTQATPTPTRPPRRSVQAQAFCFTCPGCRPDPPPGTGWRPVLAQYGQASFSQLAIPHSYPAGADRDSGFNPSRTGRNPAYQ